MIRQCVSVCKSPNRMMEQCLPSEMWSGPDNNWSGEFLWNFYFRTANHQGRKSKEIDQECCWKRSSKVDIPVDAHFSDNIISEGISMQWGNINLCPMDLALFDVHYVVYGF